MAQRYRIIFQSYDDNKPSKITSEKPLLEDALTVPTNCFDFSMPMEKQIALLQAAQDCVIDKKMNILQDSHEECPKCNQKLHKFGFHTSTFYDVFTDHELEIKRIKCYSCGYEVPSTVRTILKTNQSADLKRIQASLGATLPYRESEKILDLFSMDTRKINNHDRIKHVTESVGKVVSKINEAEKKIAVIDEAKELILNVDGGHIKTTDKKKRSMEAMTSVIYRPEALLSNPKGTRNYLSSKNCSASVKDDNQQEIISGTIVAALKQGLSKNTHITALCDGAANCWNVVEAVTPLCGNMTYILDWFHLAMKLENISLPKKLKDKLMRIKWHLWRGNIENAQKRLQQLIEAASQEKHIERIKKFMNYITNNCDKIINYKERKKAGLIFTSNLAESTVESLINRRCKGHQHMRWSREGLNPILQLRAAINSKGDWTSKWKTAVINTI
jgi:hypothetical protein